LRKLLVLRAWAWVVCAIGSPALASGISFGENGVRALSMGGAFTGLADDLSAIQHNPAGLTQLEGFQLLVDGQISVHQVEFQRTNAAGNALFAQPVRNEAGPFFAPMIAASYGLRLLERPLTFAVGVYGPPAVGRYAYSRPDYSQDAGGDFIQSPNRSAPQRYALISRDTTVLFPTLSVAWAVMSRLSVGVSLQYVHSRFAFEQAITAEPGTPAELLENARWDNLARVNLQGTPTATAVFGLWGRPINLLSLGVSVRPPVPLRATGTLDVELGPQATALGAALSGNQARFSMALPLELKAGAHLQVVPSLGINLDLVYEGWSALDQIVLTPQNVQLTQSLGPPTTLAPVRLDKRWRNTFGLRAGLEYALRFGLVVRAGVLLDTQAAPPQRFSVDFPIQARTLLTLGAGYRLGPFELVGAVAVLPPRNMSVQNSEVTATNALGLPGTVVGNGRYSSGGFQGSLGLRARWGGSR